MTAYDMLIQKGMEKGIEQEFEQGTSKIIKSLISKFPNHSDTQIAELADVDVELVKKIRKSIKSE